MDMQSTGEVLSWNNNPAKRTPFQVKEGDLCSIKVQGMSGYFDAKIVGFSQHKQKHVAVKIVNCTYMNTRTRWIRKDSVNQVIIK
jgi:hypothetical protein